MRRYPERLSRLALWSRRLAVFGAAVAGFGLALAAMGVIQPVQGLMVLGSGFACAALGLLLALAAYIEIWRTGAAGLTRANVGFVVALALLAYPARQVLRAYQLPAINDISTDLRDPPAFSRARAALEARGGVQPPEPTQTTRDQQRRAYPEAVPVVLELTAEEAYRLVIDAAQQLKWRIVDRSPPSMRVGAGRIDAVDRTPLLRFSDDVTIRIRPLGTQTRVDIRSASRVGKHDFGANAARIRRFSDVLIDLNKGS